MADEPSSSETPPEIQLCVLSQPRLLGAVRALLETFAERIGFCERGRGELVLAIDEAMTNIIRHGYGHADDCRIWMSLRTLTEPSAGIRVEIDDHQACFDPSELPERDLDEVRPGGLGIHLIRQLTRTCRHESRPEGGMRLVIEKFCEDASGGADPDPETPEGSHP
ncbi:MAG: ATP-binding protein [Phycisphaerales bacterium]|jgi:anti-sigma regulatory factor (Ser/Thr protein kinase)